MGSFDVELLFTKIPLEETIHNCVNDQFFNSSYSDEWTRKDLFDLLKLVTTETSFILDKKVSKQIDDVEIGWPEFPALASSFLCHYQQFWLYECLHQFKLVVYIHYVDDIFVLFKYKEHEI